MHQGPDQHIDKVRISEELELEGKVFHRYVAARYITDNYTVDAEDSGKTLFVQADAKTITLLATVVGITVKIMNDMDDGDCLVTIDPNGSDKITGIEYTGTDGGAATNTKATAKRGDFMTLVADGSIGWYVTECVGTWVIAEA